MQTADNVARWFLKRNAARIDAEFISNLKLQKLLYYAQGMHMAVHKEKLFEEPIEAWSYGPVVASVYERYKNYGAEGIKEFEPPDGFFSENETDTLQNTDKEFGQFSTWRLVEMTHSETPWVSTPRGEIIPPYKIRAWFLHHYVNDVSPSVTDIEREAVREAIRTDACVSKEVTNYDVDAFIRESRGYE